MKKKILSLTLVVCLLAIAVVGGTLAYFTDNTEVAVNTFTVGDVEITLDEEDVDVYGEKDGEERVIKNEYKLIPGHTYVKDPTVHVAKGSEPAYVRMFVEVEEMAQLETVFKGSEYYDGELFLLEALALGEDGKSTYAKDVWECVGFENDTYEFRYVGTAKNAEGKVGVVDARNADVDLEALFTRISLPADLTDEQIEALKGLTLNIYAEAIQADGFADAEAAFAALEEKGTGTGLEADVEG